MSLRGVPRGDRCRHSSDTGNGRRAVLRAILLAPWWTASWPAHAQGARKQHTLAYLGEGQDNAPTWILKHLYPLGYVEGDNLAVVVRLAGTPNQLPALAAELVKLKPDVIAVSNGGIAEIVHQSTKTIPIVAIGAGQLEGTAGVRSLAKPGGNVTGIQLNTHELIGKRLELLWRAVPDLRRVAVLRGVPFDGPRFTIPRDATEAVAAKLGIRVRYFQFHDSDDLARVFEEMVRERDQALVVWNNPHLNVHRKEIHGLAMKYRLPAVYNTFSTVPGEFMIYAPRGLDYLREAALYIDKILKGANPGDLPIGTPARNRLVINLDTARALGLTIPQSLLLFADEVIE